MRFVGWIGTELYEIYGIFSFSCYVAFVWCPRTIGLETLWLCGICVKNAKTVGGTTQIFAIFADSPICCPHRSIHGRSRTRRSFLQFSLTMLNLRNCVHPGKNVRRLEMHWEVCNCLVFRSLSSSGMVTFPSLPLRGPCVEKCRHWWMNFVGKRICLP